jgi:hypothetical protein
VNRRASRKSESRSGAGGKKSKDFVARPIRVREKQGFVAGGKKKQGFVSCSESSHQERDYPVGALARNLIKAGHSLKVYDVSGEAANFVVKKPPSRLFFQVSVFG